MNRFDLLGLEWSPDWWLMIDVRHEDGWWDWDDLLPRKTQFVFREQDRYVIEPYGQKNVIFYKRCVHAANDEYEWHLPELCRRGGGVSYAIQMAASLGYDPIYLVGCDLYKYRPLGPDINHFDPDYGPYKIRKSTGKEMIGPAEWDSLNEHLILAHQMALRETAGMGVSVLNATVGGQLEVYPRVDINTVLNGKA